MDCDWYPTRNDVGFDDFLPMIGLAATAEDIPRNTGKGGLLLGNSIIATPPQHPVFTRLSDILNDVMKELPNAPAWWATGPLIFTLVARGGSITLADADLRAQEFIRISKKELSQLLPTRSLLAKSLPAGSLPVKRLEGEK